MTSLEIEVSDSPDGPFELFARVYDETRVSYALSDSDMGKYYRICVTRSEFYRSVFSEVVKAE